MVIAMRDDRTRKEFNEYNNYHDRGLMKWYTAFAMEELAKSIKTVEDDARKNIPLLPQMSEVEIDNVLSEALLKSKPVSIQLNDKDHLGRVTESIEGMFRGQVYDDELVVGDHSVKWEDIRNIKIIEEIKWSKVDVFKEDEDPFIDEFVQDDNWIEE